MTAPNYSFKEKINNKKEALQQRWANFSENYPRGSKAVKYTTGLMLLGISAIFLLCLLVRFGAFGQLPTQDDLKAIKNHTASEVYSADGQLMGKYFVENRTNISYLDISPNIIEALVSTEDARFFEHHGVDMRAWFRVFFKTILMSNESAGGGSTLSQQLSKNLFPRKRYSFLTIPVNKLKEMYVARRLEKVYSKEELIRLYLNTVPFGGNIYGVEVAAKQFFSTTAKEVSVEQAAVLVGMLKANTYYNPVRNPDHALKRRNTVLNQMKKYGHLNTNECDSLKQLPLEIKYQRESSNEGLATYFREHLRQELKEIIQEIKKPDGTSYNLYTDGLKIHTTINASMQDYAEQAVKEHLSKLQADFNKHWKGQNPWGKNSVLQAQLKRSPRYKSLKKQGLSEDEIKKIFDTPINMTIFTWKGDEQREMSPLDSVKYYFTLLNAGFLVMQPQTGQILAWVGGNDHQYFKYDHVKSKRQVGSTFKPIVYTKALQSGIKPCDYINNRLVTYTQYEDWQPQNSDGKYGGAYSLEGALRNSVNSVAVDLIMRTTVDSVRQLAKQLGIQSDIPNVPAIALGAVDISLYDMVKVYGTFANRGLRPEPSYLTRIETADGEVIADFEQKDISHFKRVLAESHTDMITKMLESVVDSGTARRLLYHYGLSNDIAGKTGTTQSHADGWFMGFTPNMVAGAWVGAESPAIHFKTIRLGQGANTALPIWGRFMQKLYKDKKFRHLSRDTFMGPSFDVLEAMDCPAFLEEEPIAFDPMEDEFKGEEEEDTGLLHGLFKSKDKKLKDRKKRTNVKPKVKRPRNSAESDRIKKRNERKKKKRKKKKKKKKFWGKLFGKD